MKKLILAVLLGCSFLSLNAQTFNTPVEYNDYIVTQQNKVGEKLVAFSSMLGDGKSSKAEIDTYLTNMLSTAQTATKAVEKMGPYDHSTNLRDNSVGLFKFYERAIANDYKALVDLIYAETPDDKLMEKVQAILVKVTEEEAGYDASFQTAQQDFAAKYNIQLQENALQDAIDGKDTEGQ